MNKTALITGASNGIGLELARIHASKGDNLVLVARSKDKLESLKLELEAKYKTSVYIIVKDLSFESAVQEVYDETTKQHFKIDYLINNAGFGLFGFFHETDWDKERKMISLNITALTKFCKLYLKDMIAQGGGKIMNVASTAAFQPGPTMAIYFATKAYVLHFSEAIGNEVKDKGITVTALCPGPTESGFMAAAELEESNLFKRGGVASSKEVAIYGYKAMMKGKAVAIQGFKNALMARSVGFAPRSLVVKITRSIQKKTNKTS